jgi:transposase InsO family protein
MLVDRIRDVQTASFCTYGARTVHTEPRATGTRMGKKRVGRMMRTAGLAGRCPKRFRRTTIRSITSAVEPPDLVQRDFNPTTTDELRVSDITYVRTWQGWLYLAMLDAFSRRVVGWALADHLRTELATDALQMALNSRRPAPGLIHHSDRGSQYLSATYIGQLAAYGIRASVGRPGTCFDNAAAESLFATLKSELLRRAAWPTRQPARTAIFHYIEGFTTGCVAIPRSTTRAPWPTRLTTSLLLWQPKQAVRQSGSSPALVISLLRPSTSWMWRTHLGSHVVRVKVDSQCMFLEPPLVTT